MKKTTKKKIKSYVTLENILLVLLFITLPLFQGSSNNNGIMTFQTILFLIVILSLTENIFKKFQLRPLTYIDRIIITVFGLGLIHLLFSVNTFATYVIYSSLLFTGLFYVFYLGDKKRKDLAKMQYFFIAGLIIQVITGFAQLFSNPGAAVSGGFRDPNYFSLYLTIGTAIILGVALFEKTNVTVSRILLLFVPVLLVLVVATKSRSGTALFLLVLTAALFLKKPKLALIGITLAVLFVFVPNPYKKHIEEVHTTDPYAYTRLDIYQMDLDIFSNNFILGVGLGCFGDYTPEYNFPVMNVAGRYRVTPRQAHNSFLHWIIETGIAGLVLLFLFIAIIARSIFANFKQTILDEKFSGKYNPGADLALLAIGLMSMIHNALHNNCVFVLFVIFAAVSASFASNGRKVKYKKLNLVKDNRTIFIALFFITAVILYYFVIFISWNSSRLLDSAIYESNNGEYTLALKNLNSSIKQVPFYTDALKLRGNIKDLAFDRTENLDFAFYALLDYEQALEYSPRNGDIQIARIRTLTKIMNLLHKNNPSLKLNDLKTEIENSFKHLILNHPKNIFYLHDYAVFLKNVDNTSEAEAILEKAVHLEPEYVGGHYLLSLIAGENGNTEKREFHTERMAEIRKKYNADDYRHDTYLYELLK